MLKVLTIVFYCFISCLDLIILYFLLDAFFLWIKNHIPLVVLYHKNFASIFVLLN